jgi:hypothetical protein
MKTYRRFRSVIKRALCVTLELEVRSDIKSMKRMNEMAVISISLQPQDDPVHGEGQSARYTCSSAIWAELDFAYRF